MTNEILFAGFGGQGILFTGKIVAYAGLIEEREVSWLPSYGPEMRGGTANCSVIVSDEPVASPLVLAPDVLVAMNLPSLKKFENDVKPGGMIIYDSSLIDEVPERKDIKVFQIPATKLANDNDLKSLANVIILGKLLKESGFASYEGTIAALKKSIPPKKQHLLEPNLRALNMGFEI